MIKGSVSLTEADVEREDTERCCCPATYPGLTR